ncbi:MAG: PRC-barrel domain-containing protein [Burkholderiaceae bacterium]
MNTVNTETVNTASSVISSDRVNGTNVYNPDGEKLGSIDTLMIDKVSGKVRYAVMEFGGFLGIGSDRYPLPWESMKYDVALGGYVVSVSRDQLERAPRYEQSAVPEYTDEYGRKVYDHYNVHWY